MGIIVTRQELTKIVADLKAKGKKIVTTNGSFDVLHIGHVKSLEKARSFGDVLIVGLNSDSSVKKYKSDKRPIIGEQDRSAMLAALECVDYVTIFSETDPCVLLDIIKPNVHVKSGDYDAEKMIETPTVRKNGGEVRITPFVQGISTTEIIKKICDVYGQQPN